MGPTDLERDLEIEAVDGAGPRAHGMVTVTPSCPLPPSISLHSWSIRLLWRTLPAS